MVYSLRTYMLGLYQHSSIPIKRSVPLTPRSCFLRFQSGFPGKGPRRRQYNRFGRAQNIKHLWQTSSTFRYGTGIVGLCASGVVALNIETVPVSGRRRFNWVSPEFEQQMGMQQFQQILREYKGRILSELHPSTKMVQRVLDRLIPQSGLHDQAWEIYVIDDPDQINAFVIPGGKVFVFSGLLPICNGEDGLAAVLGHEIAHNFAHHAAENLSRYAFAVPIAWLASFIFDVSSGFTLTIIDYAYNKPGSRKQETEADFIGLLMMAKSCYDPESAVTLWQRMEKAQKVKIPQFMSTHPSDHNRIAKIREWLPQAIDARSASECGHMSSYADEFRRAFQIENKDFW